MNEAFEKAKTTISANRPLLDAIAKRLIDVETIERPEFEAILVAHGVTPKAVAMASLICQSTSSLNLDQPGTTGEDQGQDWGQEQPGAQAERPPPGL